MSKRYAIISVGTNSTRVLLADVAEDPPRTDLAGAIGTRIGEGLGERGSLGKEPMQRTLEAIAQLQRSIRGRYVRLFAIATSALRRADNADEFLTAASEKLSVPLRILSGEEEAAAAYRGAITAFETLRGERVGVADAGGGSTEYAIGTSTEPERHVSCEIGAVRLTEAVPALAGREDNVDAKSIERARAIAQEALEPLHEYPAIERLALVGGSATTAAAIVRGRKGNVESILITRADLQRVLEQLCEMPLEGRKNVVGMKPQRADILPAGIILLGTVLEIVKAETAIATAADLLLGFLLQQHDASAATAGQGPRVRAGSDSRKGRHQ